MNLTILIDAVSGSVDGLNPPSDTPTPPRRGAALEEQFNTGSTVNVSLVIMHFRGFCLQQIRFLEQGQHGRSQEDTRSSSDIV